VGEARLRCGGQVHPMPIPKLMFSCGGLWTSAGVLIRRPVVIADALMRQPVEALLRMFRMMPPYLLPLVQLLMQPDPRMRMRRPVAEAQAGLGQRALLLTLFFWRPNLQLPALQQKQASPDFLKLTVSELELAMVWHKVKVLDIILKVPGLELTVPRPVQLLLPSIL